MDNDYSGSIIKDSYKNQFGSNPNQFALDCVYSLIIKLINPTVKCDGSDWVPVFSSEIILDYKRIRYITKFVFNNPCNFYQQNPFHCSVFVSNSQYGPWEKSI